MIKHIVCFKLKNANSDECQKAAQILKSMEGRVPQIINIEVGTDVLHSARSYDIILQVTVKNMSELESYQKDPYHCETVKKHMHAVTQSSVAVDYIV